MMIMNIFNTSILSMSTHHHKILCLVLLDFFHSILDTFQLILAGSGGRTRQSSQSEVNKVGDFQESVHKIKVKVVYS